MRRYDFALLGFGNVGRALARHLVARHAAIRERFGVDLQLTAILDRHASLFDPAGLPLEELAQRKERERSLAGAPGARSKLSAEELRASGIEGLVIALPTDLERGEPGLSFTRAALDVGLDVILADKGPPLFALPELEESAARARSFLGTSGTTGAALPAMSVLRGWFGASRVTEITGILNGTSNLILTRLREPGISYASALAEAQRDGIAEPDPRLDVEGFDTAVKLVILARGLLDPAASLATVERRGITDLSPELLAQGRSGLGRLRLVGRAWREGERTRIRVAPELVGLDDPLHDVDGTQKAIRFRAEDTGAMTLVGGASSRTGTASALLRDLIAAARGRHFQST